MLEASQQVLAKKINKRVMGMLEKAVLRRCGERKRAKKAKEFIRSLIAKERGNTEIPVCTSEVQVPVQQQFH